MKIISLLFLVCFLFFSSFASQASLSISEDMFKCVGRMHHLFDIIENKNNEGLLRTKKYIFSMCRNVHMRTALGEGGSSSAEDLLPQLEDSGWVEIVFEPDI